MSALEGSQLGNYDLLERIGAGGMAEVYRAHQRNAFGREVAVKVIWRNLAEDGRFRERFLREGQAAARLAHPHILALIEVGQEGDSLFLVMPYVAGGTLRDLLVRAKGPLPLHLLAPLFGQLCQAVQHAHEHGLVHRDIKPSNLLLQNERYLLLADFGIALDMQEARLTSTGMGMGTAEYVAPEQARGFADRRSDIYSLGIVLCEMLTGRLPFTGSTPFDILIKQTSAPVPALRALNPALPGELSGLDAVVQRALAKEPEQRFQSALELDEAFQAALTPRVSATPLPTLVPDAAARSPAPQAAAPGAFVAAEDHLTSDQPTIAAFPSPRQGAGFYPGSATGGRRRRRPTRLLSAVLLVLALAGGVFALASSLLSGADHSTQAASGSLAANHQPSPSSASQFSPTAPVSPTAAPSATPTQTQAPQLSVTPTSLTFFINEATCTLASRPQAVTIENVGKGTLNWQATLQGPDVSITPKNGSLGAAQTSQMQVTATCLHLPAQTITDHILFTSNGGTADVTVILHYS